MTEQEIKVQLGQLLTRPNESHKYSFGHIAIIAGSENMVGSSLLSASAALRSGAGLVTIASTVADKVAGLVPEAMTRQLPKDASAATAAIYEFIEERHASVIVIGPGLPIESAPLVHALLQDIALPIIVDGGGLGALVDNLGILDKATEQNRNIILTPHAGEYQKLTGDSVGDARSAQAAAFAKAHNCTLVLKGYQTVVSGPEGEPYENATGNPGLATAGSGDVLSGIIAGLLGQGFDSLHAAAGGVFLHGRAADLAVKEITQPSLIASDIVAFLPKAFATLR